MMKLMLVLALTAAFGLAMFVLTGDGSDGLGAIAATPHPTITAGASTREWGDSDCDGFVTQRDYKSVQRVILAKAPLSQTEPCPDLGSSTHMSAPFDRDVIWGDWNCDGGLDVIDVLAGHRVVAGQPPLGFADSCPVIGEQVSVTELQSAAEAEFRSGTEGAATYFAVQVYLATQGLGALDLTINYDAQLVTIVNCIPSDITLECNAHFADGEVRLLATYPLGSTAETRLAEIGVESLPGGHLTWDPNKATGPNASPTAAAIYMIPYNLNPTETASPTPFSTFSPTPTPTSTPTASGTPDGSSTFVPTPTGHIVKPRGDADCNTAVQHYDMLRILVLVVDLPVGLLFHCEPPVALLLADLDCDQQITTKDALVLGRYFLNLTPSPVPSGCEPIGTDVIIN